MSFGQSAERALEFIHHPGRAIKLTTFAGLADMSLRQVADGSTAATLRPACQSISAGGLGREKP